MRFTTDKQTLEDLNIFGRSGGNSVYEIFNRTYTRGGAAILEEMFRYPLAEAAAINKRSAIIQYFTSLQVPFPFRAELFDVTDQYLSNTDERTKLSEEENTLGHKLTNLISADAAYKTIYKGVTALIEITHTLRDFVNSITPADKSGPSMVMPYAAEREAITHLLADPALAPILKENPHHKLPYAKVAAYDKLLRFQQRNTMKKVLDHLFYLDVYISVAKVAMERKFIFPKALPKEEHTVRLEGVYHPQVKNAIANTLQITPNSNIIFLTGANMAGKSTFMKTLGIALFLAHMGFPVAAQKMEFSVLDGIYTTINLADNLSQGASHFYAEVLRIKKVAKELSLGKNLFIIFDELFRGTNVKDAYEATIAITSSFAKKRNCMFVVSTHIMEAGEILKERCANINFMYLPTRMNKNTPVYTYTLESGITADRHGMIIINNEGILDILQKKKLQIVAS